MKFTAIIGTYPPRGRRGMARPAGRASGLAMIMAFVALVTPAILNGAAAAGQSGQRDLHRRSAFAADQGQAPAALDQAPAAPRVEGHLLTERWVYLSTNFQVTANVDALIGVMDRAKAAGYNGVLLADVKFGRLDDGSLIPAYYTNLARALAHARTLGLRTTPATADFGYSSAILWHDPNLAEGLPVRRAPFVVDTLADGGLVLKPNAAGEPRLQNGDFESLPASGDKFPGWAFQDAPGQATFVDQREKHGGQASLKMVDLGRTSPPSGNGRVYQRLAVEPYRYYHASVWVKTQNFKGGEVRLLVLGQEPNRTLQWNPIPVKATQDWTRFDVTFNTLTHHEVLLYLGVWSGEEGTIWWDDGVIEPAGLTNLIRRPGAPLVIESEDGRTTFAEGRDVEAVVDPKMGRVPYAGVYDLWHAPPLAKVRVDGRLKKGDLVRVSYYHMATIYGDQVAASLTEPKVFEIVGGQMASLRREFAKAGAFSGWMYSHDEIRVHGWDEAPRGGRGSPGENLALNFRTLFQKAVDIDSAGEVFTWSDMFDPEHNAADSSAPYYLVNGNWHGSWEGVPPAVTLLNWNSQPAKRRASAQFFAGRGHRQILAGYYDSSPGSFRDRAWLKDLTGVPGITGVMYTQWGSGYGQLEAWAQHVWGDATWEVPTPAADTATPAPAHSRTPLPHPSPSSTPVFPAFTAVFVPAARR